MLPLITYLLCVYLVFKGIEILQIAISSPKPDNHRAIVLGVIMVGASVVFALIFAGWQTLNAVAVSDLVR